MRGSISQKGSALLIILIAVAVFIALAFAVMQSPRQDEEAATTPISVVNSASVMQFPKDVHKAVIRLVTKGVPLEAQQFNAPEAVVDPRRSVFHENGGEANYTMAPASVMMNGQKGAWMFNMAFEINGLSQSGEGISGNELIAFLPGIKEEVCEQINAEAGINAIPVTGDYAGIYTTTQTDMPLTANNNTTLQSFSGRDFDGKLYGCFQNGGMDGPYVVYHVLAQR